MFSGRSNSGFCVAVPTSRARLVPRNRVLGSKAANGFGAADKMIDDNVLVRMTKANLGGALMAAEKRE